MQQNQIELSLLVRTDVQVNLGHSVCKNNDIQTLIVLKFDNFIVDKTKIMTIINKNVGTLCSYSYTYLQSIDKSIGKHQRLQQFPATLISCRHIQAITRKHKNSIR